MSFIISFGKVNRHFYYLLGYLIVSTLYYIPFISSYLYLSPLLTRIIESFSQTLIFIPYLIYNKLFNSSLNKKFKNIFLIEKPQRYNFKDKILLILIIFINFISNTLDLFYNDIFKNYCYNKINIEIFLLVLFSKFIMSIRFYKHLIVSQIMLALFSIANDVISYFIFKERIQFNFQSIIIFFIILLFDSIILSYKKYLIDRKYFSFFTVCSLFGLLNFIFNLILFTLGYFFKNIISLRNVGLNDLISSIKETHLELRTAIILNIIYFFIFNLFYYITLNNYTPIHIAFSQIFYVFICLLNIINNKYLYVYIIFFILLIISLLIYTEVIELNFFDLNKNIRRIIEYRVNNEINENIFDRERISNDRREIIEIDCGFCLDELNEIELTNN